MPNIRWLFLITVGLSVITACAQADVDPLIVQASNPLPPVSAKASPEVVTKANTDALSQRLSQLEQHIATALALPQSCAQAADCAVLGLGQRACGGPERYLAYAGRTPQLADWADEHQRLSRHLNQQQKRVGICSILPAPVVNCRQQRCSLSDFDDVD